MVRKLLALLILTLFMAAPFTGTVLAGYTESLSIPEGLFDPATESYQREVLLNELISQIQFFESYLGKNKVPPSIKVVLSGSHIPGFNQYRPGVTGNTVYLIQTADDQTNLGKFNTIFEQLIFLNHPDSDLESAEIISTFLNLKYFKANIPKFAGLYRYCFPNEFMLDNPLLGKSESSLSPTQQMLAVAKLAQLETENGEAFKKLLPRILGDGLRNVVSEVGMDLPTFLRSAKLSLPNTKLEPILKDVQSKSDRLWAGKYRLASNGYARSRLDALKDIENARLFIALGDEVKSRIMLDKVEFELKSLGKSDNIWWTLLAALVLLVSAGFLYAHNRMVLANAVNVSSIPAQPRHQGKQMKAAK